MEYRVLGRSGVRVAPLALGTDNFANPTPEAEARRIIDRAVDLGINLIDTSDSYGGERKGATESIIGRALKANGRLDLALIVSDLDRAAAFYEGVLELKREARPDLGFDGIELEEPISIRAFADEAAGGAFDVAVVDYGQGVKARPLEQRVGDKIHWRARRRPA